MKKRIELGKLEPGAYQVMMAMEQYVRGSQLDKHLFHLVKLRASQINGCTYCMDMHAFEAREAGETEQRLYTLSSWRETPFFSEQERAALALTESVTLLASTHVPDDVYEEAEKHFSPNQLAQLIMLIVTINAWNRIGVTTRMAPAPR